MAAHLSILAWRIHGQRSLVGYSPWSLRVTTEVTELTQAAPAALPTSLHC